MHTFKMNSLVGSDDQGADIISYDDEWVTLDEDRYRDYFKEVKEDNARELLRSIEMSGQLSFSTDDYDLHFMEYDLPVLIIRAPDTLDRCMDHISNDTPGMLVDASSQDKIALCQRNRLVSKRNGRVCLFPLIMIHQKPPEKVEDNRILAHEMVHLRRTLQYDELAIRLTFWNLDLQPFCRKNFTTVLRNGISSLLEEEWEACEQNYSNADRNNEFTNIYIPQALSACAMKLDWWLNDEGNYLNIGKTSSLIANTLFECLVKLGYSDLEAQHPMDATKWKNVTERVFRDAYKLWKQNPGPFNEKLREALAT